MICYTQSIASLAAFVFYWDCHLAPVVNNYALMEKLIEEQKQKIEELEKELEKYRPKEVVAMDTKLTPSETIFVRETLMY
jgi:hypothetical protein